MAYSAYYIKIEIWLNFKSFSNIAFDFVVQCIPSLAKYTHLTSGHIAYCKSQTHTVIEAVPYNDRTRWHKVCLINKYVQVSRECIVSPHLYDHDSSVRLLRGVFSGWRGVTSWADLY